MSGIGVGEDGLVDDRKEVIEEPKFDEECSNWNYKDWEEGCKLNMGECESRECVFFDEYEEGK